MSLLSSISDRHRETVIPRWLYPLIGLLVLLLFATACSGPKTAPDEGARAVRGFRIQIHTTFDKAEADEKVEEAYAWWSTLSEDQRRATLDDGTELPVYVRWQQPYYRVRLGNFTSRTDARRALYMVRSRFPESFIVPDTVEAIP